MFKFFLKYVVEIDKSPTCEGLKGELDTRVRTLVKGILRGTSCRAVEA